MGLTERVSLIRKIEELRGSTVMCFLTSLRQNVPAQISDDAVRVFYDHLLLLPSRPIPKLDLFLCSNGGSGTVPWRLVSLFREYAKSFNVLIPYRAYSAATLIALGADEIVMHPFAELGPIDPTVSNEFNPTEPRTGGRIGISVEDVRAYVTFIKATVGITHEDELIKAVEALTGKVHPLALGNVERFLTQSRMIARKILRTHMSEAEEHTMEDIIENMASKLYFHGHPINRKEAKEDLRLKVKLELPPALESAMWDLYKDFEDEFENQSIFFPAGDLAAQATTPPNVPTQLPLPVNPQMQMQMVMAAAQQAPPVEREYNLNHAMVESVRLSSRFTTHRRYRMFTGVPAQPVIQEDILSQGWTHSPVPEGQPASQQHSSSAGGAQADEGAPQDTRESQSQPAPDKT
jgi:Serine dehydrogenase proteinase